MNTKKQETQSFYVSGVCCATEEAVVRKHLDAVAGRDSYSFNPLTSELILADPAKSELVVKRLRGAGFATRSKSEIEPPQSFLKRHNDGVLTGVAALITIGGILINALDGSETIGHFVLLVAITIGGWRVFLRAWKSVRAYSLDMNVLMSVAVIGALAIGRWGEGASVIVLFAISLMLESYSSTRARRAIQSLMKLSPEQACVVVDGREMLISAKDVIPGQNILVRPGERIPADGVVVEGSSFVDQSVITGESARVNKRVGSHVYAGSINYNGVLELNVTSGYEDSTISRIIHLVENAQLKRAPVQNFVDRFARVYTPIVIVIAALVALLPPLITDGSFEQWLYRSLVLLVIACPCALVISTPVSIVSVLTRAARMGILMKGGAHVETLANVQAIAFDKTGTLTEGTPSLTDIIPMNSVPRGRILQIVGALEHRSEHSVASAMIRYIEHEGIEYSHLHVEDFEALPGLGVRGNIEGEEYFLGNHKLCERRGAYSLAVEQNIETLEQEGKTAVILGNKTEPLCLLAVRDAIRHDGNRTIAILRRLGVQRLVLLSGDNEESVKRIAQTAGIHEYESGLLPQAKIGFVEKLKAEHGVVAMVGDGINDAPALATASVGIAMGGTGSDTAIETADVVLMGDDLSKLPMAIRLSRATMKILKQNIAIAISLKLLFVVLSVAGLATLWMAVLADDGAALVVIFNGLRVLSMKVEV